MIISQNKDYALINKPAGLIVHSDGKTKEPTLCDFLLENFPGIEKVGEPLKLNNGTLINRPGIVHRLDRDTSGVMLVVLNTEAFTYYKKQFQDRAIRKTYHAFVYENIKENNGIINKPIGRSRNDFRQWQAGDKARGEMREAITEFTVLGRATDKSFTFIEAKPKTGRTHQIRVHFKYLFHPLVADSLYAPDRKNKLGFSRLALHSRELEFVDIDGKIVKAEAPYPEDFEHAMKSPLLEVVKTV
jgi:23S rRNA pseudouridine1911/1915/1917 synthase